MTVVQTLQTPLPGGQPADAGGLAPTASWLCCEVGGQVLAVPTVALREIVRAQDCTPLPLTPPWVRGLMNLRGSPLPVLDLASRLGLPEGAEGHRLVESQEYGADALQARNPRVRHRHAGAERGRAERLALVQSVIDDLGVQPVGVRGGIGHRVQRLPL